VVGVILFLLFGAKRLPEIGKGLGGAIREFKKVKKDLSLKGEEDNPRPTPGSTQGKSSIPETTGEKAPLPGKNT
jgi:sec-independent protein translocase protein TatA